MCVFDYGVKVDGMGKGNFRRSSHGGQHGLIETVTGGRVATKVAWAERRVCVIGGLPGDGVSGPRVLVVRE
jgi:hypothetical protein